MTTHAQPTSPFVHPTADAPADAPRRHRRWGWVMADGILGVVVGIIALAAPGITVVALAFLLGFGLLVQGSFELAAAAGAVKGTAGRGWDVFFGIVALVAGLICLFQPGAGLFAIIVGVTVWFFVAGVNELVAAFTMSENRVLNGILGVVSLVAGVVLIASPGIALGTAAVLAGILFIVRGAGEIGLAARLRRLGI